MYMATAKTETNASSYVGMTGNNIKTTTTIIYNLSTINAIETKPNYPSIYGNLKKRNSSTPSRGKICVNLTPAYDGSGYVTYASRRKLRVEKVEPSEAVTQLKRRFEVTTFRHVSPPTSIAPTSELIKTKSNRHPHLSKDCCCCRPHSTNVLPAESSTRIMWQPTVSPPRWQGKAPLCRDSSRGPG